MHALARALPALLALIPAGGSAPAQAPARFTPADMLEVAEFARGGEPVLSPDGELAAYAVVDRADETNIRAFRPTAALWIAPVRGGAATRITGENEWGDTPVWSPDGKYLAFVHTDDGGNRIALWDRSSGQVRRTDLALPPGRQGLPSSTLPPRWTPDGRTLLVPVADPEPPPAEKPRVRVLKSSDPIVPGDARFTDTRAWRLVAYDVASARRRAVTPEPVALRGYDVAPDGRHVRFRAVTPETLGRFRKEEVRTFVAPVAGDRAPWPVLPDRKPGWMAFSPDGRELLFQEDRELRAIPLAGGEERVVLSNLPARTRQPEVSREGWLALLAPRPGTGPPDTGMYSILRPVDDLLIVNLRTGAMVTLTDAERQDELDDLKWSGDGRTLVYRRVDPISCRETLLKWTAGAERASPVLSVDEALAAMSVSASGDAIAFTAMSATHPADGFVVDAGGRRRQLTDLNPDIERFGFVAPEIFEFHSADGKPLRGLLYKPAGAGETNRVPVVTYVYEKLTPQKNRFNPEAQLHVTHGYAYLMPDVLITPGYTGDSFVKSVVPAVNAVRAMGFTNGRFGITGGSFGGYAGLYLISHVDIFSGAVLRAPPSEFFSTWGDGRDRDIWTIETGQARTGGSPWEVHERYVANSPFFHADRVNTPVLILHGEKDFTVPFQQGEMMFYALRALGRTAEFAIYREGDHSIVRGSRDDFLDVYERTLAWWERYLREPSGSSAP